eukprot:CAMPEP_0195522272 /NCGR_PEP_ID=MMETSP0794_2-20130614/20245_1 /TAXON_ID=515487 /ORGANISM="Stephanopyxis turris, Strain CCMP 815" /LENGTH=955 /DNA_ID=CAMNT_0040651987 /DNA_START=156 /DNA_END=3023 /DNA_ORIENTATION=-
MNLLRSVMNEDQVDQVAKMFPGIGARAKVNGVKPHYPVALFNSLSGCVVDVIESESMPNWAGKGGLWLDIAKVTGVTVGNMANVGHAKTKSRRKEQWRAKMMHVMDTDGDGDVDPKEVLNFLEGSEDLKEDETVRSVLKKYSGEQAPIPKSTKELLAELEPSMPHIMSALIHEESELTKTDKKRLDYEASTEFAKHMQLQDGWKDPPGIKVRPRKGLEAMENLVANDPTGLTKKTPAALMLGVTSQLRDVGYEEGKNLRAYGYDWRMPCTKMEERDGYYSKTMDDFEDLVQTNGGKKIVVITHSLGGVHAHYFFHWVAHSDYGRNKGGAEWLQKHIQCFCPIGGPLAGTPFGSHSYLTGDDGNGLSPMVFSFPDRHLVLRSWGMFGMIFPTGRQLMLQPAHSVHWVRREGVLKVHILSVSKNSPSSIPCYVKLTFKAPVSGEKHTLNTKTHNITTDLAFDERFQFAWSSTPEEIDTANLEMALMHDIIGPIDMEVGKASYNLGSESIEVTDGGDSGETLPGLSPKQWQEYKFKLKSDTEESVVIARLRFVPHSDTEQCDDFSRPAAEDPGAWRCGGLADQFSTPEKQARLLETLGKEEGTEWRPEVKDNEKKKHSNATYMPMNIDQMMVYDDMRDEYKWWKESYADDKIWRENSTEAPPGVSRIRPIYGINVPTLVGNVLRRQTKRFVRFEPTTTMQLDKHCQVTHPGYKVTNGVVQEVPHKTPQADTVGTLEDMTFNTRASGDGTVAYWSLRWPVTWRSSSVEVEPVQVEGAGHRDILDKPECQAAVLGECCSKPTKYLEVLLDGLVITGKGEQKASCLPGFRCMSSMGIVTDSDVFVLMTWHGVDFSTEIRKEVECTGQKHLWKHNRWVFGVTKEDQDEDRALEISVRTPTVGNLGNGTIKDNTEVLKLPMKKLLDDANDTSDLTFDKSGQITLKWKCRSVSTCRDGLPIWAH